ncbi:hypothetical protein OV320_0715 [Actinobacteria bacterium OV320]|nr:hypothetical protein OV320_0715 [Actinobacteria bacterium OV320]
MQHPTLRHSPHEMFASLRRWTGRGPLEEELPVAVTVAVLEAAGVECRTPPVPRLLEGGRWPPVRGRGVAGRLVNGRAAADVRRPDEGDKDSHGKPRAQIVGTGIAGLATSMRLHDIGWEPLLVERAPSSHSAGYFIAFFQTGTATAQRMGVLDAIGNRVDPTSRHYSIDRAARRRPGIGFSDLPVPGGARLILRGDIEAALYDTGCPSDRDPLPSSCWSSGCCASSCAMRAPAAAGIAGNPAHGSRPVGAQGHPNTSHRPAALKRMESRGAADDAGAGLVGDAVDGCSGDRPGCTGVIGCGRGQAPCCQPGYPTGGAPLHRRVWSALHP